MVIGSGKLGMWMLTGGGIGMAISLTVARSLPFLIEWAPVLAVGIVGAILWAMWKHPIRHVDEQSKG